MADVSYRSWVWTPVRALLLLSSSLKPGEASYARLWHSHGNTLLWAKVEENSFSVFYCWAHIPALWWIRSVLRFQEHSPHHRTMPWSSWGAVCQSARTQAPSSPHILTLQNLTWSNPVLWYLARHVGSPAHLWERLLHSESFCVLFLKISWKKKNIWKAFEEHEMRVCLCINV